MGIALAPVHQLCVRPSDCVINGGDETSEF